MTFTTDFDASIPLVPCQQDGLESFLADQAEDTVDWLHANGFGAKNGEFCIVPHADGGIKQIIFSVDEKEPNRIWSIAALPTKLPKQTYHLDCDWNDEEKRQAAIGWGLGNYRFDFFKKEFIEEQIRAELYVDEDDLLIINAFVDAITLVRDLINTPANHLMPEDLAELAEELAQQHNAKFSEIVGGDLLTENYPAIYAVGRASEHDPRLLRLEWGDKDNPLISLVGKGVCFDTGGLDLKPSKFMRNMKKDMGGAAHVLGLAHMIMALDLPVRLQILIPAVDNAVSGDAYRPGDIIDTRAKKTVEIDNTDAEGRVVLCDALCLASENKPELIIDFATLTGAARVAVGTEIPALFTNSDELLGELQNASKMAGELIWPLPLHRGYRYQLDSQVADICNSSPEGYGGAITAALYLSEFVDTDIPWAHFDMMAWNNRERPGRPKGGEAMGLLAVFEFLQTRYATS